MTIRSFSLVLTIIMAGVASGCKKKGQPYFPNVGFEQYVYLNNASNSALNHPGGWIFSHGGYKGLIVYRRYLNGGSDDFAVYDRACPSHFDDDCGQLKISDDDIYAVCPCHNEKYLLIDGSPIGESTLPLKSYRPQLNGQVLYIAN